MLLKRTNIEKKLQLERLKFKVDILNEVNQILKDVDKADSKIIKAINSNDLSDENHFNYELLDADKIYHIDQIKKICIDYRLRFLDSKYFKGDLPYEAIHQIKILEQKHKTVLNGFKIIAPSKLFKLENIDDPLLFAPIGNGYYYLIHKWGNDLNPFRKLLMWPYKDFGNLIFTSFIISLVFTLLFPNGIFSNQDLNGSETGILFLFVFKSIIAIVIYYGVATGKNFNSGIWNSKYFNV